MPKYPELKKYEKKETCDYPFELNPLGYCWSYAIYIDQNLPSKNIEEFEEKYCSNCEFYRPHNTDKA